MTRWPRIFVVAVTATSYPVVRFGLDFLRLGDATYAGLTLAQWGCLPLFALGVYTLLSGWSRRMESPAGPCGGGRSKRTVVVL